MKPKLRFTTLFANPAKEKFEDVKTTTSILDACLIKGNSKHAAVSWASAGGGALAILDINKPCRLPHTFPMIRGHSGVIMDFDFYPFNEDVIITCSDDTTLNLWNIPEHFTENITQPVAEMKGHSKKVNFVQFHPSAEYICASASFDYTVKIWNIENQTAVSTIKGAGESFMSLEWNHNGSQVLTSGRDKMVRIGDPRAGTWVQEFRGHEGPKTQKSVYLGDHGYIVTTGFSKSYGREMYLWDMHNTSKPVQSVQIDQQAGTLYPFYDEDCRVLYVAGKGDGNIRYYELAEGQLWSLTQHTSTTPQKGIGFIPKRYLNVNQNELMRCLKLTNNTLEFVSFNAMRKSEGFQEDLYPPCIAGEPVLKPDEWINGKDAAPKRKSLSPQAGEHQPAPKKVAVNIATKAPTHDTHHTQAQPAHHAQVQAQAHPTHHAASHPVHQEKDNKLQEKVTELENELKEMKERLNKTEDENKSLKQENERLAHELKVAYEAKQQSQQAPVVEAQETKTEGEDLL